MIQDRITLAELGCVLQAYDKTHLFHRMAKELVMLRLQVQAWQERPPAGPFS
ncbi:hypothetical protein [Pantoea sp. CCBC3-3-1]|uniref:hypothetical protein n=1 Tax=Pantoea sp. CCBC3-3-1 TaxID=2490851 RepID=UPI00143CD422|nr:hypothetical protein [Pantoea sp. CCBC3-3-1]